MPVNYAYTIFYVKNVSESVEFYVRVFGFQQKFITPEKDYGEILSGETTIAFASLELAKSNFKSGFIESKPGEKPFGIELAFTSTDVEKLMENALKEGAVELEPIATKPWGQKVGYVRDINGFLIEICTPIQNN